MYVPTQRPKRVVVRNADRSWGLASVVRWAHWSRCTSFTRRWRAPPPRPRESGRWHSASPVDGRWDIAAPATDRFYKPLAVVTYRGAQGGSNHVDPAVGGDPRGAARLCTHESMDHLPSAEGQAGPVRAQTLGKARAPRLVRAFHLSSPEDVHIERATRLQLILAALSFARDEITWYFRHFEQTPSNAKKGIHLAAVRDQFCSPC